MPRVTITLIDTPEGGVSVRTDMDAPRAGAALSPAQAAGLDAINQLSHQRHPVVYGRDAVPLVALARDLVNPDQYGYTVTPEIFDAALHALGLPPRGNKGAAA